MAKSAVLPTPLVITVGNLKGGVGKTTTTFFLACYFAIVHGLRVLVIDADPLSQTGYSWFRKIKRAGITWPFELVTFPSKHIDDCIEDNSESGEWDVIIADTGGESDDILKAAVRMSQQLIIVAATSEAEQERIPATYKSAAEAARDVTHEIRVRVLLTKVPTVKHSTEAKKARNDLAEADYDVFDGEAHNWQWYREAVGSTNPIEDLAEYKDVGDEIFADYQEQAA